ncbi:MAG: alpha/beta hydrolase [Planctomycetales bacterium]|nr:alpha/beta hydrolase [Planctomycetales bacterium]
MLLNSAKPLAVYSLGGMLALIISSTTALAIEPETVRLWDKAAPGALAEEEKDIPTAIVYLPEGTKEPTAAIVIFPGGGYGHLAMDHEGHQIAQWANSMGMAGIIVSYRHRNRGYGHPAPMLDAQRAIRLTRDHAKQWNIDPRRVGVMGFSAGGHLCTTVLTHFDAGNPESEDAIDRQSCRPDFGIVCYAVIALGEDFTHRGSQRNLLGDSPSQELIDSLSNEKQVTSETPPCFVWHTAEDKVVAAENSLRFYSALVKAGSPSELHIFPHGRHGIGLAKDFPGADAWPNLAETWLKATMSK